jgi:chromosome segregation ATPase
MNLDGSQGLILTNTQNSREESDDDVYEVASEKALNSKTSTGAPAIFKKDREKSKVRPETRNLKPLEPSATTIFRSTKSSNKISGSSTTLRPRTYSHPTTSNVGVIRSLKSQLSSYNSKSMENVDKEKKMARTVETLKQKLKELQKTVSSKETKLQSSNEKIQTIERALIQERDKVKRLQVQVGSVKQTVKALKETLKAKDMKLANSEETTMNLMKQCELLFMSNKSLESELSSISELQFDKFSSENEILRRENRRLKSNETYLVNEIRNLTTQLKKKGNHISFSEDQKQGNFINETDKKENVVDSLMVSQVEDEEGNARQEEEAIEF